MPKNANKLKVIVIICSKCGGPVVVTQSSVTLKVKKCLHCGDKKVVSNQGAVISKEKTDN